MTTSAHTASASNKNNDPLARIDAQDEIFVFPIREYLESNGCTVVVNPKTKTQETYRFIVGDWEFVKRFLEQDIKHNFRTLLLIIGPADSSAKNYANESLKILLKDPVPLQHEDIQFIFSFFFTGIDSFIDKRRNVHEPAPFGAPRRHVDHTNTHVRAKSHHTSNAPVITHSSFSDHSLTDEIRIGKLVGELYADTSKTNAKKRKNHNTVSGLFQPMLFLSFFISIIVIPFLWYGVSVLISVGSFTLVVRSIASNTSRNTNMWVRIGNSMANHAATPFSIVRQESLLLSAREFVRAQEQGLSVLRETGSVIRDALSLKDQISQITKRVNGSSGDMADASFASVAEKTIITVTALHEKLGIIYSQITELLEADTVPFQFSIFQKTGRDSLVTIQNARGILSATRELLSLYPVAGGFSKPKTYLVLFQNSNELRPTGGFIGSVGILTMSDGVPAEFKIHDVYELDGQLKGHIDPPFPIRTILGQEHWYLRDSNWSPDFNISAKQALFFYEKETGRTADGVIAVSVPFFLDVLRATGPIQLIDYNDTITADNFFGKSVYYTQHNSFPGSTQKKDFLGSLARTMLLKFADGKTTSGYGFLQAVVNGLQQKNILFMFSDVQSQEIVDAYGWAGRLFDKNGCVHAGARECLWDPIGVFEANLSVSKVNYFVSHSAVREITLSQDGTVKEAVSVEIKNSVNTLNDPNEKGIGGPYTNYVRFYIPDDASVERVSLTGRPLSSKKGDPYTAAQLPYIEKAEGFPGIQSIGVAFSVAPGKQETVQIQYTRGKKFVIGKGGGALEAVWYKHPGITDMPIITRVNHPIYWVANPNVNHPYIYNSSAPMVEVEKNSQFIAKDGQLEYNTTVRTDQNYSITFIQ